MDKLSWLSSHLEKLASHCLFHRRRNSPPGGGTHRPEVELTDADDDEGGGSVEDSERHDAEHLAVEEEGDGEAEHDRHDAPEGQPHRERRQHLPFEVVETLETWTKPS